MDKKTAFAFALAAVLFVDNVRIGLRHNRLKKEVMKQTHLADTFQELFTATSKYVPDENVEAMKAEGNFILVTHGCIPPE